MRAPDGISLKWEPKISLSVFSRIEILIVTVYVDDLKIVAQVQALLNWIWKLKTSKFYWMVVNLLIAPLHQEHLLIMPGVFLFICLSI